MILDKKLSRLISVYSRVNFRNAKNLNILKSLLMLCIHFVLKCSSLICGHQIRIYGHEFMSGVAETEAIQ